MTTQIAGEVIPSNRPGSIAMAIRQPAGVVLSMAPWNAPIILGVRSVAMPLACGNTVVFKSSENCPRTHALIVESFREAGLPQGTINLVSNAPEDAPKIVEALIAHPKVRRINFTGSTRVGRIIAETAARYLKPVLLELGGKAPLIVLDDADLDEAVNAAVFGAFANAGQICMSTEKIVVDNKIADAFVEKFAARRSGYPGRRSARPCGVRLVHQHRRGAPRRRADRGRGQEGRQGRRRRPERHLDHERHGARPRDAGDAHLRRGILRPGRLRHPRRRRGGGDPRRQRHRIRPVRRRLHARTSPAA